MPYGFPLPKGPQAKKPLNPILGSILSSLFGGIFGIGSTIAANAYNSPAAQKRRLRKAGLPLAYMYQGRVNQQSDVPQLSIDPDLGSVEAENIAINKGQLAQTERMNTEEIRKMAQQIEQLKMSNEIERGKLDWLKEFDYNYDTGERRTKQQLGFDAELSLQKSSDWIKQNQVILSNILTSVESDWFSEGGQMKLNKAQLDNLLQKTKNLLSQDKLLNQLHGIRKIQEVLNEAIGDQIDTKAEWEKGFMWAIMQLFSKL